MIVDSKQNCSQHLGHQGISGNLGSYNDMKINVYSTITHITHDGSLNARSKFDHFFIFFIFSKNKII